MVTTAKPGQHGEQRTEEVRTRTDKLRRLVFRSGIVIAFICLVTVFSIASPYFLTGSNMLNVARQVSVTGIVAVGMTFAIILGAIDLSAGAMTALVGALAASCLGSGMSLAQTIMITMGVGGLGGLFNGYFVAYQRIPAFIVTLSTQTIFRGLAFIRTGGYSIPIASEGFLALGRGYLGAIPIPVILLAICIAAGHTVLTKTKFGRHVKATGGNEEAARLSGVAVEKVRLAVFGLSGLLASLAGLVLAARLGAGVANAGSELDLDAIASVVLGGTDLMGGRGTIMGTVLGVFIIGIISNGLTLLNVAPFYQMVIKGCIILFAVWFNIYGRRRDAIG